MPSTGIVDYTIVAQKYAELIQHAGGELVLGAKVPVLLTSRADDERSRLFSCAVAVLYAHWLSTGESAVAPEALKEVAE